MLSEVLTIVSILKQDSADRFIIFLIINLENVTGFQKNLEKVHFLWKSVTFKAQYFMKILDISSYNFCAAALAKPFSKLS